MAESGGTLWEKVEARLAELRRSPSAAERIGGLSPGFIRDLKRAKKRSVNGTKLDQLARALDWHREELLPSGQPDLTYAPLDEHDPSWRPDADTGGAVAVDADFNYSPQIHGALPEINVAPGAGQGVVGELGAVAIRSRGEASDNVTGHMVTAEWLLPEPFIRNELHASPRRSLVMPVIGDSMTPTYQPGDRVMVDLNQNTLIADTVYVIDDRDGPPQIKRLQKVPYSEPPLVHIISDNPAHRADPPVELARVRIVGRVCGHVARR